MSFLRAMRLSEPNFGKMAVLDNDLGWQPMPTVEDMERLCSDVAVLNQARRHGLLKDAIQSAGDSPRCASQ